MEEKKYKCSLCGKPMEYSDRIGIEEWRKWNHSNPKDFELCRRANGYLDISDGDEHKNYFERRIAVEIRGEDVPEEKQEGRQIKIWRGKCT